MDRRGLHATMVVMRKVDMAQELRTRGLRMIKPLRLVNAVGILMLSMRCSVEAQT